MIDEIVAVVGDHIILRSDLEAEYMQAKKDMSFYSGDLKCEILNQLIIQKLYLEPRRGLPLRATCLSFLVGKAKTLKVSSKDFIKQKSVRL